MKKNRLILISIILFIFGTVLLITSISYLLPKVLNKQSIVGISSIWNFIKAFIGLFSDIFSIVLGISSLLKKNPPALVPIPTTAKTKINVPIVGRDDDLKWLRSIDKDSLLVGQPGSGKTFLLYKFAKDNLGLFVDSDDINSISREYKKKRPKYIIVDDSQLHIDLLDRLIQFRERKKVNFIILVSCWPSFRNQITDKLNLPEKRIHNLGELTRDEIIQVIKNAGLGGSEELIREIVNQSSGRPGLSVTLTDICLKGGVKDVVLGDVLARNTANYLSNIVGDQAIVILAGFAIGGDAGVPLNIVADELRVSLPEVQTIVTYLTSGLILQTELGLAVYPPALRFALVRDKFFGIAPLPLRGFIERAPSLMDVGYTLVGAKARGAKIPLDLFIEILQNVDINNLWGSSQLWKEFAYLGTDETNWVLMNHPEHLLHVAQPALFRSPDVVIPLLLKQAVSDTRQLSLTFEHPLKQIHDWVIEAYPGRGIALPRRKSVLNTVKSWLASGGAPDIGYRALKSALSPEFNSTSSDPGSETKITIHYGALTLEEILSFNELWSQIIPLIENYPSNNWIPIREIVEMWAYPGRINPITPEVAAAMKAIAEKMLNSLLPFLSTKPGFILWAHHLSSETGLNLLAKPDPIYEILYPVRELKDWRESEERQKSSVRDLAKEWASHDPNSSMQELFLIEENAKGAGAIWPRWTPYFCTEIVQHLQNPLIWARAGIRYGLPGDIVEPFLAEAIRIDDPAWVETARQCLGHTQYKFVVIKLGLIFPNLSDEFVDEILSNLDGTAGIIETYCVRNEVPEERVLRLLKQKDTKIARAAARGEWFANPSKTIRESLRGQWEIVVTNDFPGDYYLEEVFLSFPQLAVTWLNNILSWESNLDEGTIYSTRLEDTIRWAALALDFERRKTLLARLTPSRITRELIFPLVGDIEELFRCLISNAQLKEFHLKPLYRGPSEVWVKKAIIALEAGYGPRDILDATLYNEGIGMSWEGNASEMWIDLKNRFEPFLTNPDDRIKDIAKIAVEKAESNRIQSLKRERQRAIYGR